jgi:RND family efflux transporter MFP subunit
MKSSYLVILFALAATSCSKEGATDAERKKQELADARKEYQELKTKINTLESELKELDPEFAKETDKAILVSSFVPGKNTFQHKFDVRGSVKSKRNVLMSAEIPARIDRVHVRQGQNVSKGQLLVSLDADVLNNSIKELETQLELANTIYERQARLWEQKIGTEVQYLQAKNNKESLESRLATTKSQIAQANLRAPFSGSVDEVPAREGEMASPGIPLVRLTSPEDMYIEAEVSERFLGKVVPGDRVEVQFPMQEKSIESTVAAVSDVINPENRTFRVDVRIPGSNIDLRPNQVTILQITDYVKKDAISIPTRLLLRDDQGEYVYAIEKKGKDDVAKKIRVKSGMTYSGQTEIIEGLKGDEQLIDKGFRDVAEGVQVAVAKPEEIGKVATN